MMLYHRVRKAEDLPAFTEKMIEEFAEGVHCQKAEAIARAEGMPEPPPNLE